MSNLLLPWSKSHFDGIGDLCKAREAELRGTVKIESAQDFIVRVDGRAFHTVTRGLKKPFDTDFSDAMGEAARAVLMNLKPHFAYYQSDEITYVFKGSLSRNAATYQHPFGGRVDKLLSVIASLTSVAFLDAIRTRGITVGGTMLPHFDARLVEITDGGEGGADAIFSNTMWRENDAVKNAIAMAAQALYSQKQLQGLNTRAQLDLINGKYDYENMHRPGLRCGTYLRMGTEERELTAFECGQIPEEFRPDPGTTFTRSTVKEYWAVDWSIETRKAALWE